MKEIEQSQTVTIKRSSINLNPSNIKHHSPEQIKKQKDNIRDKGLMGGIVWNELTFNLIDGNRRVQALDQIHKYDPNDPTSDYDIKVEKVALTEKEEKEQLVFMSVANTNPDFNLIADFITDIDYKVAGISEKDYKDILTLVPEETHVDIDEVVLPKGFGKVETEPEKEVFYSNNDDVINPNAHHVPDPVRQRSEKELIGEEPRKEVSEEAKKNITIANKEFTKEVADNRNARLALVAAIRFASEEEKQTLCDLLGIDNDFSLTIDARVILDAVSSSGR